jgi:magnesium transporter
MAKKNPRRVRPARVSRTHKAGLPPGTPLYVGRRKVAEVQMQAFAFHGEHLREWSEPPGEVCSLPDHGETLWVNVSGVHDMSLLASLAERFQLHPLTTEDIANTQQRPKLEEFPGYAFLVLNMLTFDQNEARILREQVSLVFGKTFVLTLIEDPGDVFDPVRARLRARDSRLRTAGADHLAYALMDALVDHYFLVLEQMGDRIETLEEENENPNHHQRSQEIHNLRRDLITLRKSIWPLREAIGALLRSDSSLIQPETRVFLRDLQDHAIQIMDVVESNRELLSSLQETHMARISHRLNEVMKVLTTISTIFIPLTFLVGVYGMNFQHMPELAWRWGYPAVWLLMVLLVVVMVVQFKRRGWF